MTDNVGLFKLENGYFSMVSEARNAQVTFVKKKIHQKNIQLFKKKTVNRTCLSINGGSPEILFTTP